VDGEIGRITFHSHSLVKENKLIFNSAKDVFKCLRAHEWYRTESFNELAFSFVIDLPYKKAASKLNRIRGYTQREGTPYRTLANMVEIEAKKIDKKMKKITEEVLQKNNLSLVEKAETEANRKCKVETSFGLEQAEVERQIKAYNTAHTHKEQIGIHMAKKFYEQAAHTVNISMDDVGVKHQKETGRSSHKPKKEKREYVENSIAHVEKAGSDYYFNAASLIGLVKVVIAFLFVNHLEHSHLQFFVDGARSLQNIIIRCFGWCASAAILLDWYHLKEKCKMQLSLACRKTDMRNSLLEKIISLLWFGKLNRAIKVLQNIEKKDLKSEEAVKKLIDYFERNRDYIPCYALRKELGLRNSSNKGEKANDIIVANRQKHNGMSWSEDGSVALATITSLYKNNEQENWFKHDNAIEFKLAS
jgi:hypothetical protein